MGRARIVSGGTDGLYTVEVLVNRERIEAELAWLAQNLESMATEIGGLEETLAEVDGSLYQSMSEVMAKIQELQGFADGVPGEQSALADSILAARGELP
jgi:prefoldin subunit 5